MDAGDQYVMLGLGILGQKASGRKLNGTYVNCTTPSRLIVVLNKVVFKTFSTVYRGPGRLMIELDRHFSNAMRRAGPSSSAPPRGYRETGSDVFREKASGRLTCTVQPPFQYSICASI